MMADGSAGRLRHGSLWLPRLLIGLFALVAALDVCEHGARASLCPGGVLEAYDCDAPLVSSCYGACPPSAPLNTFVRAVRSIL